MVNGIEQCDPQQPTHRVFEQYLFCALNQPCLVVPTAVVQGMQLNCEVAMIALVSRDHLVATSETRGVLPTQTAVETFQAFAKLNTTLLRRNQQSDQFSRRARAEMRPVVETISRQRFEHPDESGVLLPPSLNEELSVA